MARIRVPLGLAVFVARTTARVLLGSVRLEIDPTSRERLEALPDPAIFALWHEQILTSVPFVLGQLVPAGRKPAIMASRSRDGELVARVARSFGVHVVRGSASRGGREGLRALYRAVTRDGASPLILPDGPRGPRYRAKPGIVVLSQMTRAPIVPMALLADAPWRLRSWDRMVFPKPFRTVRAVVGQPLQVPRQLADAERDRLVEEVDRCLGELQPQEPAA